MDIRSLEGLLLGDVAINGCGRGSAWPSICDTSAPAIVVTQQAKVGPSVGTFFLHGGIASLAGRPPIRTPPTLTLSLSLTHLSPTHTSIARSLFGTPLEGGEETPKGPSIGRRCHQPTTLAHPGQDGINKWPLQLVAGPSWPLGQLLLSLVRLSSRPGRRLPLSARHAR